MNMASNLRKLFLCFSLSICINSCTSDDILPSIQLATSSVNLSEDNGTITITASVNTNINQSLTVPIVLSGTATVGSDFGLSTSVITINSGSNSGSIIITGIQDDIIEGVETLNIALGDVKNVLILSNSVISVSVLDDDSDSDSDGVLDANDNCPDVAGDIENDGCPFLGFLINEVLYDPAADLPGDANGDGVRDANQDEFIEFYNSGTELDISGYTVSDASAVRHIFPTGTIVPKNGVLVLFGGGSPTGSFGGAMVQVASEGQINISNAGDTVTVRDADGNEVVVFDLAGLSGNPDESYTRNPDLTGDFAQHSTITEAEGRLFSPGTKLDGSSL
ncbi:MAG: lamin tail domain-containing protein [Flavobacteriaceae bacterium]|nr:lamin tail domain-containing protein [Flavobacteriaceae bacterium]